MVGYLNETWCKRRQLEQCLTSRLLKSSHTLAAQAVAAEQESGLAIRVLGVEGVVAHRANERAGRRLAGDLPLFQVGCRVCHLVSPGDLFELLF